MEIMSNGGHIPLASQRKSRDGAIDACKKCSGLVCCGLVSEGGIIELPYLTINDITQIEYFSGLRRRQFATERKHPVTGNIVFTMKTTGNQGCLFFNREEGKCQIFSFRPMDCRLFPLDIEKRDTGYYWALYKYNRCKLKKKDKLSLLEYRDEALRVLGSELCDYATYPVPGMQRIGYEILMQVKNF